MCWIRQLGKGILRVKMQSKVKSKMREGEENGNEIGREKQKLREKLKERKMRPLVDLLQHLNSRLGLFGKNAKHAKQNTVEHQET